MINTKSCGAYSHKMFPSDDARCDGFTLIEILVAISIFGILMVIVMGALGTGSKALGTIVGEAEIAEETRSAADIISYSISQAAYIYPPNTVLTLNSSGYTTQNPKDGSHNWTVGGDPILAMIVPPDSHGANAGQCGVGNEDLCYAFVAYYPVKRETVVQYNEFLEDPSNEDQWVLYEYKRYLTDRIESEAYDASDPPAKRAKNVVEGVGPSTQGLVRLSAWRRIPTVFSNGTGNILADYIAPNTRGNTSMELEAKDTDCYNGETKELTGYKVGGLCSGTDHSIYQSLARGTFTFQAEKKKRGKNYKSAIVKIPISPLSLHQPFVDRNQYSDVAIR